nr:YbaB/EbfC family nucleoid-associated protein [Sutterella sp.]
MGGGMGGMGGLMAQAQKMQQKLAKVQEELKAMEFTGEAGNGAVKATITGGHECRKITIDPAVVDPDDIEMLEDLIVLAINNAETVCREKSEAAMRQAVPLPPGMKLPF